MRTVTKRLAAAMLALLAAGCADAPETLVAPGDPRLDVTFVNLFCPSAMQVGQTGSCGANIQATNPSDALLPKFWSSTNPSAVQVSIFGDVYAVAPGTATISLQVGGRTGYSTIQVVSPPPPLSIGISGPTSIAREGQAGWSAQVSGTQSGESVTYRWESSTDGGASWTQVGTSQYYYRTLSSGSPSFQLRLTVTSSILRYPTSTSTATTSVSVANPLLPALLSVTAAGPDNISAAGWYYWTAYPSGGVAPYSYVWEKSNDGSTWTNLVGSRYTYPIYTQTAEMYFGCSSSAYLRYRVKVTSSDGQVAYGYRSTNVYVPYC